MITVPVMVALWLDWWLGEPRRWHPLVGYGAMVDRVESALLKPAVGPGYQQLAGLVAWLLLVGLPVVLLAWALQGLDVRISALVGAVVLYFSIGARSLAEHARAVADPLAAGDLEVARRRVAMLVSRDTTALDEAGVARATTESVLENGSDAVLAPLFWFAVAGAPGVLAHRLANTLDARWGYRTSRYRHFGRAAARLDDLLNWLPARLCALGYGLAAGRPGAALDCWRRQAPECESPNAGPVMAAGAGALGICLGGDAVYHGERQSRPVLGRGRAANGGDIARAVRLLVRTIALWVGIILMVELAWRVGGGLWH